MSYLPIIHSPAHIAASYGLTECLKLLKTYGANLGMPSVDGATPIHEAAANGHPGIYLNLFRKSIYKYIFE